MRLKKRTGRDVSLLAKILLISDLHKLSVPVGQQKGQALRWHEKIFEGIIDIWKRWNVAFAIPGMMRKIFRMTVKEGEKFDFQIVNGDVIESEYNERGMIKRVDCRALRKVINEIPSGVTSQKTFVVSGDHELGYRLPLSTDPLGGISLESIDNFFQVAGPLWQRFSLGGTHFLLLSSSLMMQKFDHLAKEEREKIEKLREQQRIFILDTLENIPKNETVFVFLHDPDAIVKFHEYICEYDNAFKKNFTVFCGHMHAEWSLRAYKNLGELSQSKYAYILPPKILEWAKNNKLRMEFFEKYNLIVIPAPGGMMGIGGGFLVMNLYNDGAWEIEKHK